MQIHANRDNQHAMNDRKPIGLHRFTGMACAGRLLGTIPDVQKSLENNWFAQWFAVAESSAALPRNAYKTCCVLLLLKTRWHVSQDFAPNVTFFCLKTLLQMQNHANRDTQHAISDRKPIGLHRVAGMAGAGRLLGAIPDVQKSIGKYGFTQWFAVAERSAALPRNAYKTCRLLLLSDARLHVS